ncbi:ubiquitin-protein ligase [Grosmannia clavigera kw1407]|uniref:HECT-type E3 ubiquitin transferase n=1 Tax=Grosmannia clavigera (strain kw1407 / UAMH 11150) TaxID=655863 RepID=F0X997_GROCL|nr:ubiquitin-protein ligase [Grosmannia clavigera kw1407]EFX05900.1 ubiquitin-protein ligase [Grosmannia clavigera kw1407]
MSSPGSAAGPSDTFEEAAPAPRRSSRGKKAADEQDTVMTESDEVGVDRIYSPPPDSEHEQDDSEDNEEDGLHRYTQDSLSDSFGGGFSMPPRGSGLPAALSMLGGMLSMSGIGGRLREILNSLRQKDDPSVQLIALQDLSEILLVSNEDNLSGSFSPDAYVRELVSLMQPNEITGEENPEVMLLACRCLANLMEALPASVANVVYGGAVSILCQKLLEISFIDLAEQALSTLEKISFEYPASIVREGGLTACLSYLEFFATSTQRTAVTTAANCCRNIPEDSFPVVRDVMPILLNVLNSSDQRVVEQAALCVSRIVESFKHQPSKLEELVGVDMLKAILRLLLPGSTNYVMAPNLHTQFLRVLAIAAHDSPHLAAELFKMNVVETLYQILTGVSPPPGTEDITSKLDSVLIMQALIHRPREQIIETLNVICNLLPREATNLYTGPSNDVTELSGSADCRGSAAAIDYSNSRKRSILNEKRIDLLKDCKLEVRRFALILFPTLTDAYSSTVNLDVRSKVLSAQLKMLSNFDQDIIQEALKAVPYASFLASILSQQDHSILVKSALQATELLLARLDNVYRYQLYREGVINEIEKIASMVEPEPPLEPEPDTQADSENESLGEEPLCVDAILRSSVEDHVDSASELESGDRDTSSKSRCHTGNREGDTNIDGEVEENDGDGDDAGSSQLSSDDDEAEEGEDGENNDNDMEDHHDEAPGSPASSDGSTTSTDSPPRHLVANVPSRARIAHFAKRILDTHETEKSGREMRQKATEILSGLFGLAQEISSFYLERSSASRPLEDGIVLFERLAGFFDSDVFESVTSAELLESGLVRVLELIFSNPQEGLANAARSAFLEVFMGYAVKSRPKTATSDSPTTPFSILVHKLQDLLSRSENFEVVTVHHNTFDGNHSSAASMLAKQIRLRLVADDGSDIPGPFRSIMVSIHAIATFQALEDYLRPRINLSDRSRNIKSDGFSRALAAMAGSSSGGLSTSAAARLSERSARLLPGGSLMLRHSPSAPSEAPASTASRQLSHSRQVPPAELEDIHPGRTASKQRASATMRAPTMATEETQIVPGHGSGSRDKPATHQSSRHLPAFSTELALSSSPGEADPPADALDWSGRISDLNAFKELAKRFWEDPARHDEHLGRSIWSTIHLVHYRRVPGSKQAEVLTSSQMAEPINCSVDHETTDASAARGPLDKNPIASSILRLLRILHDLNANIDDVLVTNKEALKLNVEPLSQFVNTKLTAKLNRQLEEPLIVASSCLPNWSEDLAGLYPFLFPFETRHLFLQSTSFGYARSMARWQNSQVQDESRRDRRDDRPYLGRLQRQKVRISRSKILESAVKVMELYGASQSMLEVEYFEEVGTGLGPTLEFYSTVSREFSKKKLKLWRDNDFGDSEFVTSPNGLFPRPLSNEGGTGPNDERILSLFRALGKFVARSMLDSRIIDINFNPIFFRIGDESTGVRPSLGAIKVVDPTLARSLQLIKKFAIAKREVEEDPHRSVSQKVVDIQAITVDGTNIDDLSLDFTLPGYPEIELVTGGAHMNVTIENVDVYIERVVALTLGSGVRRQVDAFRNGFSQVFPYSTLSAFTPDELSSLFGRIEEDWSLETLVDSVKADHGFNMDSSSVKNLLQVMSELTLAERRDFLQFTTGSPKLPIGGFRSLTPMFTVVCKPSEPPFVSDDYLPSVMTCVNYLKLPDYTTVDVLRKRLFTAIKEGQGAFHLS